MIPYTQFLTYTRYMDTNAYGIMYVYMRRYAGGTIVLSMY